MSDEIEEQKAGSKSAGETASLDSDLKDAALWRLAQDEIRETDAALILVQQQCYVLIGVAIGLSLALWLVLWFHRGN